MLDRIKKHFTRDTRKRVKFFSGSADKNLKAYVVKENYSTYILELPDGNVVKKKKTQVELLSG